jgi:hypothetical protein
MRLISGVAEAFVGGSFWWTGVEHDSYVVVIDVLLESVRKCAGCFIVVVTLFRECEKVCGMFHSCCDAV